MPRMRSLFWKRLCRSTLLVGGHLDAELGVNEVAEALEFRIAHLGLGELYGGCGVVGLACLGFSLVVLNHPRVLHAMLFVTCGAMIRESSDYAMIIYINFLQSVSVDIPVKKKHPDCIKNPGA